MAIVVVWIPTTTYPVKSHRLFLKDPRLFCLNFKHHIIGVVYWTIVWFLLPTIIIHRLHKWYKFVFCYVQHRTGCLVGCLRKLQNWCMSAVVEEYKHFAGTKWRETDVKFLEKYDVSRIRHCLESIIYRYYGSKKRRLQYREESLQKPQMTSVL